MGRASPARLKCSIAAGPVCSPVAESTGFMRATSVFPMLAGKKEAPAVISYPGRPLSATYGRYIKHGMAPGRGHGHRAQLGVLDQGQGGIDVGNLEVDLDNDQAGQSCGTPS